MNPDGERAEDQALRFLLGQGLKLKQRNYACRLGEIDLILTDGKTLVFAEVRMRRSGSFGGAAESITPRKRGRLVAAASGYLALLGREPPCRFDAVLLRTLDPGTIEWRRDIVGVD